MEIIQTLNCGKNFSLLDEQLAYLQESDVTGIRLNFNKYSEEDDVKNLTALSDVVMKYKERYKFLYDIPYPYNKTRILDYNINGEIITEGEVYELYFDIAEFKKKDANAILLSPLEKLYDDEEVIYFGDGQGAFEVVKKENNRVIVKAIGDFDIYRRKSITYGKVNMQDNLGEILNIINKTHTSEDYGCALSLVENCKEIYNLKKLINSNISLIAKIETKESMKNLDSIIQESDGVMIARGDLALLNQYYKLYFMLENIIKSANYHGRQIYMATDILQSMDCGRYVPSRADIIDVTNTYVWQSDFVILGYHINMNVIRRKIFVAKQIYDEFIKMSM